MSLKFLLLFLFFSVSLIAQNKKPGPVGKVAPVEITVTNMKGIPQKGEEVIFRGEQTGRIISFTSGAGGKIKATIPPGDNYNVSLKCISDTTKYAVISVPELGEDEYFTDPFTVTIQFELARSYQLDHVHFDIDKATLRPDSYKQLTELLEYLQRHPDIKIEIAGHTDNTGGDAHNLKLSQDRANTIRNYLLKKGIKPVQVTAKGYGSSVPVADNNTDTGKQMNRRTEVRIL